MRKLLTLILTTFVLIAQAQILEPVQWSIERADQSVLHVKATIDDGWHLYDTDLPEFGPKPTQFSVSPAADLQVTTTQSPTRTWDENFGLELSYYEHEVTFIVQYPSDAHPQALEVEYMACNDVTCLPPTTWQAEIVDDCYAAQTSHNLLWIFLMGLLGGLLAVFTPCVWPIIPMTVSFFLKRSGGKAVKEALLYGLSIIVIYVGLGLIVTLIFGASALNDLSTNAIVNLLFFLLLVVFALSFFGAFELTLPASWSNRLDSKARSASGVLSILLMAFTLVIVSFSCTGPIIGTLLVEAAGRSLLAPAVGMLGFAMALALPFSLFAMFPDWMRRVPKSGGWMESFKVVLAFLELALSLKFFSVADLAYGWHLMDREVFVALWIVIFGLLGLYLLGEFHFKHEQKPTGIGVLRFMLAVCSLSFSLYMLPGLWGAPLKAISAFAPPMWTQDFSLSSSAAHTYTSVGYDEALEQARKEGKQVLIDFTGYGCVNCRKMEAKVFTDLRVQEALQNFVVVSLIVDDKTHLDSPVQVTENGKQKTLRTVGDMNSYIQRSRFGANAQPYYVRLKADGTKIGTAYSYDEDADKFLQWLKQ